MVLFASRERTLEEYQCRFRNAGLAIEKVVRTQTPLFVLDAVAA